MRTILYVLLGIIGLGLVYYIAKGSGKVADKGSSNDNKKNDDAPKEKPEPTDIFNSPPAPPVSGKPPLSSGYPKARFDYWHKKDINLENGCPIGFDYDSGRDICTAQLDTAQYYIFEKNGVLYYKSKDDTKNCAELPDGCANFDTIVGAYRHSTVSVNLIKIDEKTGEVLVKKQANTGLVDYYIDETGKLTTIKNNCQCPLGTIYDGANCWVKDGKKAFEIAAKYGLKEFRMTVNGSYNTYFPTKC